MMPDIENIRNDFPLLSRQVYGKPLVYLDNGATAQKPLAVIRKTDYLYRSLNANIHRGVHHLSAETTLEYENARERIRGFINASSAREIIFTSGATAGINTIAFSFGEQYVSAGDNIIVSEMEHHSNIVPWQMLCEKKGASLRVLPFSDEGELLVHDLDGMIDERTRIIAVTQASNVLGMRPDLRTLIDKAHAAGVPVLVDGCQGIVHGGVDVRDMNCDFYVFSGHKLYGPTGIGVLYGKEEYLGSIPPYAGGGDMVKTVSFDKTVYADLPLKFEAGTSNYIGAIGLAEAVGYIASYDPEDIARHEDKLRIMAEEGLRSIDGIRIYGQSPEKCPIVSFTADGTHPYDIGMILDKMGIAIRTGTHCAEPIMAHYGITGMCRASIALYNTEDEIEKFVSAVERAVGMLV